MKKIFLMSALLLIAAGCNKTTPADQQAKNIPDKNSQEVKEEQIQGSKLFDSSELGIKFYYSEKIGVKQEGSKVFVYAPGTDAEKGQWVQVFTKAPSDSLTEAIRKTLLSDYPDCAVSEGDAKTSGFTGSRGYPDSFIKGAIHPKAWDNKDLIGDDYDLEKMFKYIDQCPKYVAGNGIAYFLADKNYPDKFAFFSIGQYALFAGSVEGQEGVLWQDTLRFK